MLHIYSPCVYFRKGITELINELRAEAKQIFVVLDSRYFSSLGHMLHTCYRHVDDKADAKVIVLLNGKFVSGNRDVFPCGVNVQESLSRWRSCIQNIAMQEQTLKKTIACLARLTSGENIGFKHREVVRFISMNLDVNEISRLLMVSPKTVYGYFNDLKNHFHQPRLSNLYRFIKELDCIS